MRFVKYIPRINESNPKVKQLLTDLCSGDGVCLGEDGNRYELDNAVEKDAPRERNAPWYAEDGEIAVNFNGKEYKF